MKAGARRTQVEDGDLEIPDVAVILRSVSAKFLTDAEHLSICKSRQGEDIKLGEGSFGEVQYP